MKEITIDRWEDIPAEFIGKINWDRKRWGEKGLYYCYVKNQEFHREDGPAVIYIDGPKYVHYFLNGEALGKDQWFDRLTPEQKIIALYNEENW